MLFSLAVGVAVQAAIETGIVAPAIPRVAAVLGIAGQDVLTGILAYALLALPRVLLVGCAALALFLSDSVVVSRVSIGVMIASAVALRLGNDQSSRVLTGRASTIYLIAGISTGVLGWLIFSWWLNGQERVIRRRAAEYEAEDRRRAGRG